MERKRKQNSSTTLFERPARRVVDCLAGCVVYFSRNTKESSMTKVTGK